MPSSQVTPWGTFSRIVAGLWFTAIMLSMTGCQSMVEGYYGALISPLNGGRAPSSSSSSQRYSSSSSQIYEAAAKKRDEQALSGIRKAAEQGECRAQYELGMIYYSGKGVTEDKIESYAYYKLSVKSAWEAQHMFDIWSYASSGLNSCESGMTEGQIAAGDKRVLELQKEIEAKIAAKAAGK
jgi:TPR repeat protein